MFASKIKTRYSKRRKVRYCQGDVLKSIDLVVGLFDFNKHSEVTLPYCVVLNQDCDLEHDYDERKAKPEFQDKYLTSLLLCPAYPSEIFFLGQQLDGCKMKPQNSGDVKKIMANDQLKRYHYLKGDQDLQIPNLVIDFKHFYTVPINLMYKERKKVYLVTISELFREQLSQRFANFLSRIGVPELN